MDNTDTERSDLMRPELVVMLLELGETDLRCLEAGLVS